MLIKVLVVLAILIMIVLGVFLIFNPLEKNREKRDQRRVSDLSELKKALDFYITKNAKSLSPLCQSCTVGSDVFVYREIKLSKGNVKVIAQRYVNSHGWVPVDLSINAGLFHTPLKILPIDPLEETFSVRQKLPVIKDLFPKEEEDFVYTYTPGENGKYKLTAKMESKRGLEDASSDGGSIVDRYELGELGLAP